MGICSFLFLSVVYTLFKFFILLIFRLGCFLLVRLGWSIRLKNSQKRTIFLDLFKIGRIKTWKNVSVTIFQLGWIKFNVKNRNLWMRGKKVLIHAGFGPGRSGGGLPPRPPARGRWSRARSWAWSGPRRWMTGERGCREAGKGSRRSPVCWKHPEH